MSWSLGFKQFNWSKVRAGLRRKPAKGASRNKRQLAFEALEVRSMLAAAPVYFDSVATSHKDVNPTGLSPNKVRGAYGLGSYTAGVLSGGISFAGISGDGRGQTIAIVDAFDYSTALNDLNAFSTYYGLPTFNSGSGNPTFQQLTQTGQPVSRVVGNANYVGNDPAGAAGQGLNDWEGEEAMDIEWAHAIAPMANIDLFEATDDSNELSNLFIAAQTAANTSGVVAVSNSWSDDETNFTSVSTMTTYDSTVFVSPSGHIGGSAAMGGTGITGGVTFLVAAGDNGAYGNGTDVSPAAEYPSSSPNVVSVGGTSLTVSTATPYTWSAETAWGSGTNSDINGGSGGGISGFETLPSYQTGVVSAFSTTNRTFPDVAALGDPSTGVPVYDTYDNGSSSPWTGFNGGTSLSTPIWAGLIALTDEGRAIVGLGSLDGTSETLPELYSLPSADFHDIVTGSTGPFPQFSADVGYDLTTGLGSPVANKLVPALINYTPTVTSISPTDGSTAGGTAVAITGTDLTDGTIVKFGTSLATNVVVVSSTEITCTSPAGSGTADVTVTGPGGTSDTSAADQFTYLAPPTVSGVSPDVSSLTGGITVTITGTNFIGVTAVNFGTTALATFNVVSPTQITVTSPAGTAAGAVDVTVDTSAGPSATSSADQYIYETQPTITGVSPPTGKLGGGTTVTITGTNLAGATAVDFGGSNAATIVSDTDTQIVVTTPSGAGTVDISVTDPGGTSATVPVDQFSFVGPPTVATAAKATPSTVTGTTTSLSVLGADVSGENTLTYTWSTTVVPNGATTPTFSVNGTNGSKNSTATFYAAGSYTFLATISDVSGQTVTSSVVVTVSQTLTSITVSPANPTIYEDQTQQFAATGYDQFGTAMVTQPAFTWGKQSGVGSITAAGLYGSPSAIGMATVAATSGSVKGTTGITVLTISPTIVTAASATPSTVTGTTTALAVVASDEHTSSLTYTWTTTLRPNGSTTPNFSVNGTNASQNTTATFYAAGNYTFQVTVTNIHGLTITSSVSVTVSQTLTTIGVTPPSPTVGSSSTQQFAATGYDQFGTALTTQPTFTWSTTVGTISSTGLLTTPATAASGTITATSGGLMGTAGVTVVVYPKVNAAYVISDPLLAGKTALYVYGIGASDSISVNAASAGYVTVLINGKSYGTFNPTGRIIIHGLAGTETIIVSPKVTLPTFIYAGTGNDTISSGGGASVIVGGGGKNTLYGGAGRSILIAGAGASVLAGGAGDSLLVAGTTTLSTSDAALLALLNEWNSSESYAQRAADMQGATGDSLAKNTGYYLNSSTVKSNGVVNHLSAAGLALYYQNARDIAAVKKVGAVTVAIK